MNALIRPSGLYRQSLRACLRCHYSTAPPPAPPLLLKLKNDLKSAMRAKDTARLNVVRGILSEVTNASKSSSPIKSDLQLLSMLKKRAAAAQNASKEFQDAGRSDLKDQEEAQIAILGEYAGEVKTMDGNEIKAIVTRAVNEMKSNGGKVMMGDVLKRLLAAGGDFDGKPVEKAEVAVAVKQALGQ